jgi:N-acetylneuraminic acid mutarotase
VDAVDTSWVPRPPLNVARGGLTSATLTNTPDRGRTYAIGGFTTGFDTELDSVEVLDPERGRWHPIAPMRTARGNAAASVTRDGVFVFGGFARGKPLDVVEILDLASGRWRAGRPLPGVRGGAGAAAIGELSYVVGGFDADDRATGAVFAYDPHADTWRDCRPMRVKRGLLKVAALSGYLYAVGGAGDGRTFQAAVERYDPATDTWQATAPLSTGRGNPGVAVAGSHIVVVGGVGAGGALRTSERYDARTDRWHAMDPLLAAGRGSLAAAYVGGGRLVAFGGFEPTGGTPTASARVEALALR